VQNWSTLQLIYHLHLGGTLSWGTALKDGPGVTGAVEENAMIDPSHEEDDLRPGVDFLLTFQVAQREKVAERTVQRWIDKGLPAVLASQKQIGELITSGLLKNVPAHGKVYLIRKTDLHLIPGIRAYPTGTTRPRRGKTTGAGAPDRQ
jgi:hypothetical protein